MDRSRDLLFGVIALQAGFLDEASFVENLVLLASKPDIDLEALLLERGTLKESRARLIKELLDERLADNDGDLAETLKMARSGGVARALERAEASLRVVPAPQARDLSAAAAAPVAARDDASASRIMLRVSAPERYRVSEELGRGGLGVVQRAYDRDLMEREVAMKLMHADLAGVESGVSGEGERGAASPRRRFLEEAQITAHLAHPNIVTVYELGERDDGALYYTMPVVGGRSMKDAILEGKEAGEAWTENRRSHHRTRLIQALLDVCQAIAYAHSRGVIHRDLKPSNIMLGDFGETIVLDWGLAKVLNPEVPKAKAEAETVALPPGSVVQAPADREMAKRIQSLRGTSGFQTLEGTVTGTPAYMAPEQAAGRISSIDERSDIYSLGAMLYEVLTEEPPYAGASAYDILMKVIAGPPESISARPAPLPIPEALAAIVSRAMAREKDDRYARVEDLRAALSRYLEGVEERERSRALADAKVSEGERLSEEWRSYNSAAKSLRVELKRLWRSVKSHHPIERKRPLWAKENRAREMGEQAQRAFAQSVAAFHAAIAAVPGHKAARRGLCELYFSQYLNAERARERAELLVYREFILQYDPGGYADRLEPRGRLSLRAFAHEPGALRPIDDEAFAPRFDLERPVPISQGRPSPGVETARRNSVPLHFLGPGVRWGYADDDPKEPIAAQVTLYRFEEHGKRLVEVLYDEAGPTPIQKRDLPAGSYLCVLAAEGYAEARVPVRIDRDGHWDQSVTLYRREDIPAGFCYMPGGPYSSGGERAGGFGHPRERITEDLFVSRLPVTCGEYLEFLNAIAADSIDRARALQPREDDEPFWIEDDGRFRLPGPGDAGAMSFEDSFPVMGLSFAGAVGYALWRSRRDRLPYRLLTEWEFEKAARGVDGRIYPFGDFYDGTFSHTHLSFPEPRMAPAGSFAIDRSVYGIADLSGGMQTWLLDCSEEPYRYRMIRGGSWATGTVHARAANRQGYRPASVIGARLALCPRRCFFAEDDPA